MARTESKRQKRLAKQKAKRSQKRQELKRTQQMSLAQQLERFETAPVVDCLIIGDVEERGLGNVFVGRKTQGGEFAGGTFLLDVYCLGVKDCFGRLLTPGDYREFLENFEAKDAREIDPASAKRLIEDAVAYAKSIGFSPHPDFRRTRPILNGIDSSEAQETFEMGKDGKPFFFAGPNDSQMDCRRIISTLERTCGPEGFHYLTPVGGFDELDIGGDLDEWDDDFDD